MSVAASLTMDERPLMNSYEKMSKQYEHTHMHASGSGIALGSGGSGLGGGVGGSGMGGAPPSGPASPTPSGSEEPSVSSHSYHRSSHHHHHSHSSHSHHHQVQQQPQQFHHRHAAMMAGAGELDSSPQQQQQPFVSASGSAAGAGDAPTATDSEQRVRQLEDEIESLKAEQSRMKQKCFDSTMREHVLMRRLAHKDVEYQDYINQIAEYKAQQTPTAQDLRSALLDPAINILFDKMKKELKATKAKLEETQNELSAWKFTPDSNTGKRLMAKCRLLYQENEELGKMTSSGRVAKLETELAMQKAFNEEVRQSQSELDDFLQELDEDVEGMQGTIMFLQQELKMTRERIEILEKENSELKNGTVGVVKQEETSTETPSTAEENGKSEVPELVTPNNQIPVAGEQVACALPLAPSELSKTADVTNDNINVLAPTTLPVDESATIVGVGGENQAIISASSEIYNNGGSTLESETAIMPASVASVTATTLGDDGSNGSNNSLNGKFRTVASRKRNYDSDSTETNAIVANSASPVVVVVAPPIQQQTPRTLPPKKSKLHLTPVRRASSSQSMELNNESECVTGMPSIISSNDPLSMGNRLGIIAEATINEEITTGGGAGMLPMQGVDAVPVAANPDEADGGGGVAQRIMTRRRSVRTQQQQPNGTANGGNGESAY